MAVSSGLMDCAASSARYLSSLHPLTPAHPSPRGLAATTTPTPSTTTIITVDHPVRLEPRPLGVGEVSRLAAVELYPVPSIFRVALVEGVEPAVQCVGEAGHVPARVQCAPGLGAGMAPAGLEHEKECVETGDESCEVVWEGVVGGVEEVVRLVGVRLFFSLGSIPLD